MPYIYRDYFVLYQNQSMKSVKHTLFLALCALSLYACKGKDPIKNILVIDQDIPYVDTVDMSNLPQIPLQGVKIMIGPIPYGFATNYQSYLNQYHTSANLVSSAKLKSFSVEVLTPSGQDMSFLDTLDVTVYGDNSSLQNKLIAYHHRGAMPAGTNKIDFNVVDEELKDYFLRDSVKAGMSGWVHEIPAPGTRLLVRSTFHLVAKPLE